VEQVVSSGKPYDLEDDELDPYMDFNTQMFAEYDGLGNGRNILENRPNGNASARRSLVSSFIPGWEEQRSIYQFQDSMKNKLSDDR
jgi:hypothetical protein